MPVPASVQICPDAHSAPVVGSGVGFEGAGAVAGREIVTAARGQRREPQPDQYGPTSHAPARVATGVPAARADHESVVFSAETPQTARPSPGGEARARGRDHDRNVAVRGLAPRDVAWRSWRRDRGGCRRATRRSAAGPRAVTVAWLSRATSAETWPRTPDRRSSDARTSCSVGSGVRRMNGTRRAGSSARAVGRADSRGETRRQEARRAPRRTRSANLSHAPTVHARRAERSPGRSRRPGSATSSSTNAATSSVRRRARRRVNTRCDDLPVVPRPRRPRAQAPADHHLLDVARVHAQRLGTSAALGVPCGHFPLSPDSTNAPMWRNFL